MLHPQKTKKEQESYNLNQEITQVRNGIEEVQENEKIYNEITIERKRFLVSSYLMKGQDDLEMILETLHDHFKSIKLTSFEELAKNNHENKSAKQLLDSSNTELKQLQKTLELL